MSARHVKGTLFVDYVRMLRVRKDIDWTERLPPEDLALMNARVDPNGWYPMETFERMGLAILNVIADGELEMVQAFGRASVNWLVEKMPMLVAKNDPRESLMRFQVLRQSFFDFPALTVKSLTDKHAALVISYQMGDVAEEAAALQTMGFFERLLEMAGAKDSTARFVTRCWARQPETLLELTWR